MQLFLTLCVIFIFGCARLIHGGNKKICSFYFAAHPTAEKLPFAHGWATILATLGFTAWGFALHHPLIIPVGLFFAAGWSLTFQPAIQAYFSIGHSQSIRRPAIRWIDSFLAKTFGPLEDYNLHSWLWWIGRDSVGYFLRMSFIFPLALGLAFYTQQKWYVIFAALQATITFGAGSVIIYGLYNWFWPSKWGGDDAFNPSELALGMLFGTVLFTMIASLANF